MTKPYRTSETRWFFPGAMSKEVTGWFIDSVPGDWAESVVVREDIYLLVPGRDDIGLKFRRDKIQLKMRGPYRRFSALKGQISGIESRWERHSWSYDESGMPLPQALSGQAGEGRRIAVVKKRRQKTIVITPKIKPRLSKPGKKAKAPVLIEITEISFPGYSGWSLGLETIDPKTAPPDLLLRAVEMLLADCPALPLKRAYSLDYPELIRKNIK